MIYIIGSGAIGKALAVFLKLQQRDVELVRGSVDNQPSTFEVLRIEMADQPALTASIKVSTLSSFRELKGIVVLTNKSFGNENLSVVLKTKGSFPLVILQNGLGVEQPFIDAGFADIYRCVLFATSQTADNAIRFKPVAVSRIGTIRGNGSQLTEIVECLDSPNFRFATEANIQPVIWKKAIANSVFNSVCPLLETDNGIFHRNKHALAIAERVIKECVSVADASGITIQVDEVLQSLLAISKASNGQLISTLQDIRKGRRTEIETLNFSIVAIARRLNLEAIVPETKLLGELTRLKSELAFGTDKKNLI